MVQSTVNVDQPKFEHIDNKKWRFYDTRSGQAKTVVARAQLYIPLSVLFELLLPLKGTELCR